MNTIKTKMTRTLLWAAALSLGTLAMASGPAGAQESGILFKNRAGDTNYCHMEFPAIREDTLTWDRPVLQNPRTGDIVTFYGPCDFNPIGEEAVERQQRDREKDSRSG